jgi:hypothetical protein
MKTYKKVDVGDAKQVEEAKTKVQIAREREIHELKEILETYRGRALVWRILAMCGLQLAPPNDFMARHIGRQDIGRELLQEVFTSAPNVYTVMRQEAEERDDDG